MSRPAGLGPVLAAAALAMVLSACGSNGAPDAGRDGMGAAGVQVATVSYGGRVYLVDCTAVAASRLGAPLHVAPEQASGQLSGARAVTGIDPSEGFAIGFSNAVCGPHGPDWIAAVAAEVARSDPARTRSIRAAMRSG